MKNLNRISYFEDDVIRLYWKRLQRNESDTGQWHVTTESNVRSLSALDLLRLESALG